MGGVVKHGMAKTPVYKSYHSMMARCYDESHQSYKNYGGREDNPIKVCERWHEIENFLKDAVLLENYTPNTKGLTLDRKDVDGDYCPENCRWATNLEQQNNRRDNVFVEWNGERMTIAQLARKINVQYGRLFNVYDWHKGKLTIEEIVERAIKRENKTINLAEVARENNVTYTKLYHQYVTKNKPLDEAIEAAKLLDKVG